MAGRGVLFALSGEDRRALEEAGDENAVVRYVIDVIEEGWSEEYLAEVDKAWDAIHRCLTDGRLLFDNGSVPLNRCILGGRLLTSGDCYVVAFTPAEEVSEVAARLDAVSMEELADAYWRIDPDDYGRPLSDEDFQYTWGWFTNARRLWRRAASTDRSVIFTVDL